MFGLNPIPFYAIVALLFTNIVAVVLWRVEVVSHRQTKLDHAEYLVMVREKTAETLEYARSFNDTLIVHLAEYENTLVKVEKEKQNAVAKLTKGTRCLDAPVVGVLNNVPGTPDAQAQPGPVPPDGAFATDTDVGLWIANAQHQYDTCRGRLDAIADFYEGVEKKDD